MFNCACRHARAVCLIGALSLGAGSGQTMEANTALRLVQAWGKDSKDMTLVGRMTVGPRGEFLTRASGAFFRFDPTTKQLLVSGLVVYRIATHSKFPDTWDELVRAGEREKPTLGEGQFELYTHKLMEFEPDVVLLTKRYSSEIMDERQFAVEVRWLLSTANYWLMKRYYEVSFQPEEELIREAPGINARWPKRPW